MGLLHIKVIPGAASSEVSGWLGDVLKIRVSVPPEKGRANKEVLQVLSRFLQVPPGSVTLVKGRSSPLKTVEVAKLTDDALAQRISSALSDKKI